MLNFLRTIFTSGNFEPHITHFTQNNLGLARFIIFSNILIVAAYVLIPVTLVFLVWKRKDLVFNWIFLLFGLFISLCGATHAMHIIIFSYPLYWLQAIIDGATIVASAITAVVLLFVMKNVVRLTTPKQLQELAQKISAEIESQKKSAQELLQKNIEFEKVTKEMAERNQELEKVNSFMAGRELKAEELKKELNKLKNA